MVPLTPISSLPVGVTGYRLTSEEQFLNDVADKTDVKIIEADDFLKLCKTNANYALPDTLNTTEWWKVFNQGSIGSCLGCADAQTATGVNWLATGEVLEFSKFLHYLAIQLMGDLEGFRPKLLGRDSGSLPSMALLVAAKWGYCPSTFCPPYPVSYKQGLRTHRQLVDDLQDESSELRNAMAPHKIKEYVRITKVEQIIEAKKLGAGFVQQSSIWPKTMDEHPERIERFTSSLDRSNRHAGGHAYQVLDIHAETSEPILGNSWGNWGDEGAKTISIEAEQAMLDDPMTICYLKTDLATQAEWKPRSVPIKMSDLT